MKKLLAIAVIGLMIPAVALAHVGMHGSSKVTLIEQTFGGSHALTHKRALDCFAATRSTVNRSWADAYFSGFTSKRSHECDPVGSNGVAFVHFARGRWHTVDEGSDFPSCRVHGVPHRVVVDLAKSLPRGFGPAC
jgi:hypothetical protein